MQMELNYERGTYFEENSHPTIVGKVVLETTEDMHGEPAYRLAEKEPKEDEIGWYSYWQPARHLHDEVGVGAVDEAGELDEEKLSDVESLIGPGHADTADAPERVIRVRDVMSDAAVESIVNTERDT